MGNPVGTLKVLGYTSACVLAGIPTTFPLHLSLAVTRRFGREDRLKRLHRMVEWAGFCRQQILQVDLDRVGAEHLPLNSRGHMFVSNHQSWIDILVLMESLNTVAFLSKQMVRYIPVLGSCAYAGGTIFINRRLRNSRQQALEETLRMCKESTAVVVFPEGTRSFDGELRQEIHPRAIEAAYEHGLKVIPVAVDGTSKVLPKSMDRLNLGQRVAVTIGEPLKPREFGDSQSWVEAVWGRVTSQFQQSRGRLR